MPGATATAAAHAQSSVALHGLLDASIAYTNNQSGKHAWASTRGGKAAACRRTRCSA
ncbi:hypothetical protein AAFM48_00325 [Burkholderia pseudomallei]